MSWMNWKDWDWNMISALALLVIIPLTWGLGVDYVFELLRRRKRSAVQTDQQESVEE